VKGEVFDLLLSQIFRRKWFEGHAVVTHSSRTVSAHLLILWPHNFAILLVELVVEWRLFNNLPRVFDDLRGRGLRRWDNRKIS
jgi:hypothetical protein